MFNFWWSAGLVEVFELHLPPLSSQKSEMLVFGLHSTSDDWPGWSMDSNPVHHPSLEKNMKCSFLDYIQLLMISQAGQWTRTPSATPLQPKKWNAHFWIAFNFWWSARLVDGLKPHLPPLSSQKNEMLILGLRSTSDDRPAWSSSTFYNLPHPLPLPYSDSVPEQETGKFQFQMDIYVYIYIWTQTPSAIPLQPNKMKCSFLDYVHLLMISQAGQWTRAPSATHLQPKKWNAHFWITFNFWWLAGLVNGLESCPPPLSSQKNEMHFWIAFNFWWLAGLVNELEPHLPPLSSQKSEMLIFGLSSPFWWSARLVNGLKPHLPPISSQKSEMLIFGLHSTSDNRPGWSMDSNPIHHLSPAKNMKCSFLDYVQLLMIGWAGWWT